MSIHETYKQELARHLSVSPGNISLFWKGRVALYAILKAMGVTEGDEVILPAFTCVVVPNAILYLGAKPVYVDIDPQTYTIDPALIERKITPRTRVILAQNTFGLSADLQPILALAKKYDLKVVEDCAHGFGGSYIGQPNGSVADAAFFSTQWNKPFSTGIGGMGFVRDETIAAKVLEIEKSAVRPSWKDEMMLRSLITVRESLLTPALYWSALKMYRYLSKKNLLIGSSQGNELSRPVFEHTFVKGMSGVQAKRGVKALERIEKNIEHRKSVALKYNEFLKGFGIEPVKEPANTVHTFIKYPLLVNDREEFMKKAVKSEIELSDWFNSPIHPIQSDFDWWQYKYGENPISERASAMMVNLPTHSGIDDKEFEKISRFLEQNKKHFEGIK